MRVQPVPRRPVRAVLAGLTAAAVVALTPAVSSALPTADFTISATTPAPGAPVTFTFTGTCDQPPCSVVWTWFQDGGSHLGTRMGFGDEITYAFPRSGLYAVVARITNANSTHGSASATHDLVVGDTVQENGQAVRLGGWSRVATAGASKGGEHVGTGSAGLWFAGGRLGYVACTGPGRGIARLVVDGRRLGTVDLYSATPGVRTRSLTGLGAGVHFARLVSTGTRNLASTGIAISLDEFLVGATVHVDDNSLGVRYAGWAGLSSPVADGGGERITAQPGAQAMVTFSGTTVTWETAEGPDQGIATVLIDDVPVATVDNYAAATTPRVLRTFTGLTTGSHTLRVVVAGQHQAASTGNGIVVDAFVS
ncbi:PKD domain-containing protein [Nocardioides ultimimeridianus]